MLPKGLKDKKDLNMVIKYNAIFKNGSTFNLFGEEYFNDRVEFNRVHRASLKDFFKLVEKNGKPISIINLYDNRQIDFLSSDEFDEWFKKHQ